ncbi:MAG: winged helix-turn-helix domain-containing protein [Pirellulaceae bacterium]
MVEQTAEYHELRIADIPHVWRERPRPCSASERERVYAPSSYRMKLGRETVHLDVVAFRILQFLSASPYRAYTRRRIAEAVSSHRYPVAAEALDQHIRSLRQQLGFFRDYIQAVPYIGYRFKA